MTGRSTDEIVIRLLHGKRGFYAKVGRMHIKSRADAYKKECIYKTYAHIGYRISNILYLYVKASLTPFANALRRYRSLCLMLKPAYTPTKSCLHQHITTIPADNENGISMPFF